MKLLFAILLVSLVTVAAVAQQTAPSPWIKDSGRAQYNALSRSGREALYNLEYDKALLNFREINRLHPTHPAGPQLLAARLWAKTLYESRRLQASLYSSETFYATGDDKVDQKVIDEFRTLTRDAKRRADVRLQLVPKDIEALYWLGSIEGLKASFAEAVERRHIAALRAGNDAVDHHREVLKLDPTQLDANLTIGLYEYVVGSLPLPIKLIAGVTGFRGSKKKGLTLLEQVVKEGSWARDDAAALLVVLYTREKRYQDALVLTRQLTEKYPRNYLVRLEAAGLLVAHAEQERKAKRFDAAAKAEKEAFAVFDQMLEDRALRATMSRVLDLVHFKYGEALLTAGEGERAAKEFLAATKAPHAEPGLVTMAHLYAARALDMAGKRNEALSQYKQVLTRPDIYSAHDAAKKGLREPYRNELASNGQ